MSFIINQIISCDLLTALLSLSHPSYQVPKNRSSDLINATRFEFNFKNKNKSNFQFLSKKLIRIHH
ncbi:hypothetical protein BpHYR1_014085 [Brachionus plicatilis]|uniref:Uncharacterized protein n=1 Tax=Brachionus plicatilis TaxID=10195 RepID=A0A3M7SFT1_BRAPC|nr:hypothetical protein BpHYR1_014085 [Brachionus plicatilis]